MSTSYQKQFDAAVVAYREIGSYQPRVGDFVIWSGWFTSWHGIVTGVDQKAGTFKAVFATLMSNLANLEQDEICKETREIGLSKVRKSWAGAWSAMTVERSEQIWYV